MNTDESTKCYTCHSLHTGLLKNCETCRAKTRARRAKETPEATAARKKYTKEYQAKRRADPAYVEKQRLYMQERRKDPKFQEHERLYFLKYKEERGIE